MASLLTNSNLQPLVNIDENETVSLVSLLLSQDEQKKLVIQRQAKVAETKNKRQSRSDRLSKTKTASTSKKGKVKAPIQKSEQLRKVNKNQEKAKERLLAYELQQGRKNKTVISSPSRLGKSKNTAKAIADAKRDSLEINSALRPVTLAMLDFVPSLDDTGNMATPTGNIIKINRAIRVLNAENLPADIDTSSQENLAFDFLDEYSQYVNQVQSFLASLDINNLSILDETISFLALKPESTTSASNTQLLLTILRDYASAIENCSPRLFEAEERDIPGVGSSLADRISGIDSLKAVLKSEGSFDYLQAVLGEDDERTLKILLYQISSELKLSYNASKWGIQSSANSLLQAPRDAATIIPSTQATRNFLGMRTSTQDEEGRQTYLFPLEGRDILPDDSAVVFDSAPDVLARNIGSDAFNVYNQIATNAKEAFSSIAASLDTADFSSDYAPSVGGFILIIRDIAIPLLQILSNSKTPSRTSVVEFLLLSEAGKNNDVLAQLMLFLAALKEELARPSVPTNLKVSERAKIVGSLAQVPVTSNFLNTTIVQSANEPLSISPPTATRVTKVNSFAPKLSIGSISLRTPTVKRISRPRTSVTSTTANAGGDLIASVKKSAVIAETAGKSLTLSKTIVNTNIVEQEMTTPPLSTGFVDTCDATAALLFSILQKVSINSASDRDAAAVNLSEVSISSSLKSIVTADDDGDVFIALLTLFDDFIELFSTSDGSCFSSGNITNYSGISRGNIEIAFFMCIAKVHMFLSSSTYSLVQGTTQRESVDISMKTGYLSSLEDCLSEAFESSIDIDVLARYNPSIARIMDSLITEEAFIATLPAAFSVYLDNISEAFKDIKDILVKDTGDSTTTGESLQGKITKGLPIARDSVMSLKSLVEFYNSDALTFSSFKSLDVTLNDDALTFFSNMMKEIEFLSNKKVVAVALPAGLCDSVYNVPVSLEDISRDPNSLSKDTFEIVVDKIDLTRPTLDFEEKIFSFPRNIFLNSFSEISEGIVEPKFSFFDESLEWSAMSESDILSSDSSLLMKEKIGNLKNDIALKIYSSLLYNLDFSSTNYPVDKDQQKTVESKQTKLNYAEGIDLESLSFLSGSNLAFDELQRTMSSFSWYDQTTHTLDFNAQFGSDAIAYSVWEYLSAIGVVAFSESLKEKMSLGSKFERILLVPIDPYDFAIKSPTFGVAEEDNLVNQNLTLAEEEVGVGLETSQGVELATFRITIRIPESESV